MRAEFAVPIAPASGTSSLILTNVIPRHGFSKTAPTITSLQPFFRRTSCVISKSKHRDVIYGVLNQLPNRNYAIFEPVHFFHLKLITVSHLVSLRSLFSFVLCRW